MCPQEGRIIIPQNIHVEFKFGVRRMFWIQWPYECLLQNRLKRVDLHHRALLSAVSRLQNIAILPKVNVEKTTEENRPKRRHVSDNNSNCVKSVPCCLSVVVRTSVGFEFPAKTISRETFHSSCMICNREVIYPQSQLWSAAVALASSEFALR